MLALRRLSTGSGCGAAVLRWTGLSVVACWFVGMKQQPSSRAGFGEAGPPFSGGAAAVPGAVAVVLDAVKWLVPQPPCRIHHRSHAAQPVIGPVPRLALSRGHAAALSARARRTSDACRAAAA